MALPVIRIGISIKYLRTGLKDDEYRAIYSRLILQLLTDYQDIYFPEMYEEHDKHGILHLHGVLECPKKFFRNNLLTEMFNINMLIITNEFGWRMYMTNYAKNKEFKASITKTLDPNIASPHGTA